ncbi:MAG TPA: GNAT family N-acetyltransferase [Ktedonobacteraceae bacterium]
MAVDLLKLHELVPIPTEFVIERVRTEQELQVWTRTLAQGFGEGEIEAGWIGEMYRKIGFGDHISWRHYLGWWRGEPVATTSLFMSAGVAGIYFVFTLPGARHQGIGAAMTVAALRDAQQFGYRVGVLTASAMGYPVYQRLGFQEYCRIELYELTTGEEKHQ